MNEEEKDSIEILKLFKDNEIQRDKLEIDNRCGGWKIGKIYKFLELNTAIETVLSMLEEKDKTIEKLRKDNTIFALEGSRIALKHYIENNYIPVQKVKDEIDRIDYDIKKIKEIISNNSNIYTSDRRNDYQIVRLRAMNTKSLDIKKRLQELLKIEEYEVDKTDVVINRNKINELVQAVKQLNKEIKSIKEK